MLLSLNLLNFQEFLKVMVLFVEHEKTKLSPEPGTYFTNCEYFNVF